MAVTLTPHQRALLQLLPDGLAWDKRPSSVLAALCLGLSQHPEPRAVLFRHSVTAISAHGHAGASFQTVWPQLLCSMQGARLN